MPDRTPRAPRILQPTSVHATSHVGYSHLARVGKTLYVAGQVALDRNGDLVGADDAQAQTRQVYANLHAILQEQGGSLSDIVKLTTYLTDRSSLAGFRLARDAASPRPFPPNTLLFVAGLAQPEYLVEIEAIAELE